MCELKRETENKEGDIKNTNVKEQRYREEGKADDMLGDNKRGIIA